MTAAIALVLLTIATLALASLAASLNSIAVTMATIGADDDAELAREPTRPSRAHDA